MRADPVAPVRHDSFVDLDPGRRIGPIRIGMRRQQVIALLGTPAREHGNFGVDDYRALRFEEAHLEVETDHEVVVVIRALPGWPGRVTDALRFDSTVDQLRAAIRTPAREMVLPSKPSFRELDYAGVKFRYWMVKGEPYCDGGTICAEEVPVFIEVRAPSPSEDGGPR